MHGRDEEYLAQRRRTYNDPQRVPAYAKTLRHAITISSTAQEMFALRSSLPDMAHLPTNQRVEITLNVTSGYAHREAFAVILQLSFQTPSHSLCSVGLLGLIF